jgi:hypothetical protein
MIQALLEGLQNVWGTLPLVFNHGKTSLIDINGVFFGQIFHGGKRGNRETLSTPPSSGIPSGEGSPFFRGDSEYVAALRQRPGV